GAELGLDVFAKSGQRPRFGVDLSTGIGDFDVYGDAGLRFGNDFAVVNADSKSALVAAGPALADPNTSQSAVAALDVPRLTGFKGQFVGGASWSRKYNDNDILTIGAEYFYNQAGYSDRTLYPTHLAYQSLRPDLPLANFFYLGRHYGAVTVLLPAPYSWNYTTFALSTLGNLSDRSYVSRLDYSVTFLTHLTFQAFAALHYGQDGGELRFSFHGPPFNVPTPLIDLGVALRLKF
ncbi:MAG TPA: hypothetical protein VMU50_09460, partial [Polyangia bacterium]|nr:hypothetical protein [Polyangia bacterium]